VVALGRVPARGFAYVFHGSSGSPANDVRAAIAAGVVKVNLDTDAQYAFTRAVAGHMRANVDGVLKVDGGIGRKPTTTSAPGRQGRGRACGARRGRGQALRVGGSEPAAQLTLATTTASRRIQGAAGYETRGHPGAFTGATSR
jgi:hypothetical protein